MLVLTRKVGESIYIGDDIEVVFREFKGNSISLGIKAPTHLFVRRHKDYKKEGEKKNGDSD